MSSEASVYLTPYLGVRDGEGYVSGIRAIGPNPSSGAVRIAYTVAKQGMVKLDLFDIHGRRIATLVDAAQSAGEHTIIWRREGAGGLESGPGIYVLRFLVDGRLHGTRRLVAMK